MSSYRYGSGITQLLIALLWCCSACAVTPTSIYNQPGDWTDDHGNRVSLQQWAGKQSVMAMAYTECNRICNVTLHHLEEAQELADKNNLKVDFIIFSFDPSIDGPESWTYYRKLHHLEDRNNWHFLTGTSRETQKLAKRLGIDFWLDEDHVMHDLRVLYIDGDGSVRGHLDWDHQDVIDLFKETHKSPSDGVSH